MKYKTPKNFHFSDSARKQIEELLSGAKETNPGEWIVAVVWIQKESSDGISNGPGIAIYNDKQLDQSAIQTIDGIKVVFPSPDPERFTDKILSFSKIRGFHFA
jgi:hypothetical protein